MQTLVQMVSNCVQWVYANVHENIMSKSSKFLCSGYARMHRHDKTVFKTDYKTSSKVDGIMN